MNKTLLQIYIIIFIICCLFLLVNFKSLIKKINIFWGIKYLLMFIAILMMTYSIYKNNFYINTYILPLLVFLNIGILLLIDINANIIPNTIHIISIISIIYLLVIFNYKDFKMNNGILVNPNYKWIYLHIVVLILWYISSNNSIIIDKTKIRNILLILYPLLFPLNEFFIHRVYSLLITFFIYL